MFEPQALIGLTDLSAELVACGCACGCSGGAGGGGGSGSGAVQK